MARKAARALKRAGNVLSTLLLVAVLLLAVALAGVRLFGLTPFAVVSGSMEPELPVGCLVYVKKVPAEEIEVGDAISFVLNEDLVVATHQVRDIDLESGRFYTQGINNRDEAGNILPDGSPVLFENYLGKVVAHIPLLGYISQYISNPPGLYVAIGAVGILLGLCLLTESGGKKEKQEGQSAAHARKER